MSVLERITVRIQEARRKLMCDLPNFWKIVGKGQKIYQKKTMI